jgi:hypothetical protein
MRPCLVWGYIPLVISTEMKRTAARRVSSVPSFICLSTALVSGSWWRQWAATASFSLAGSSCHPLLYTSPNHVVYIYIYVYVCVCVCVYARVYVRVYTHITTSCTAQFTNHHVPLVLVYIRENDQQDGHFSSLIYSSYLFSSNHITLAARHPTDAR